MLFATLDLDDEQIGTPTAARRSRHAVRRANARPRGNRATSCAPTLSVASGLSVAPVAPLETTLPRSHAPSVGSSRKGHGFAQALAKCFFITCCLQPRPCTQRCPIQSCTPPSGNAHIVIVVSGSGSFPSGPSIPLVKSRESLPCLLALATGSSSDSAREPWHR